MSEPLLQPTDQGLTWENRLALWLPRPLFFGALLAAVCISAMYLCFQWVFELGVELPALGVAVFIVFSLMAPRNFTVPPSRVAGMSISDRRELEVQALQVARSAIRVSRFAGAAGVAAFVVLWEALQIVQGADLLTTWLRLHSGSATTALFLMLGWIIGRFGYFAFAGSYRRSLGPQRSNIDLLNLEDIYAFGRSGLRDTLALYIVVAIGALLIVPELGTGLWVVLPMFAFNLGVGLLILLSPAREVRGLIRNLKREELARLGPLLHRVREDALTNQGSTHGRLADLLAYKAQIESTREWPFDSSTLLRFGLYLFIPVISMVGGALMERAIDILLD
ncbi:MAG: hypothetical protein O7B25_01110 [Gammaproteobacteria bacterium]|nr:hypothetical protein [Gammaproteobacteria bacterium]